MINDTHPIYHSCTPEQWEEFETKIEIMHPQDLAAVADRLSLELDENAEWRDFCNAFGNESWREFTEAYEHVMRVEFTIEGIG